MNAVPAAAPRNRRLAVCADDFGMSPGVSLAIAALAEEGRLDAISCLVCGPHWRAAAALLRTGARQPRQQVGLHFNLTEGAPLSAELAAHWPELPALPRLIIDAHLGRLPLRAIAAEWQAQWAAYGEGLGRPPQYVDGHQHVHHLPGVRQVMLRALAEAGTPVAVRNTGCVRGAGFWLKRQAIELTGGRALQLALRARGLPHNRVLIGVYDFEGADYRRRMQAWLRAVPPEGALLFCHPGASGSGDAIGPARVREHAYLASPAFDDDLAAAGVERGPVWTVSRKSSGG